MARSDVSRMLRDARTNAALAWLLVGVTLVICVGNLAAGERLWAGFAVVVAVLGGLPALALRTPRAMPPWEVLALAALPLVVRSLGDGTVGDVTTYVSVAALALLVAVELDVFTPVEMTYGFAVVFVVVTTMATAGVWAVVRWGADIYLGTGFGLDERALMLEFVASTAVGFGAGLVYELYFRRVARGRERLEGDL